MIKLCNLFKHYSEELSFCERLKFKLATHKQLDEKEIAVLLFIIKSRVHYIEKELESLKRYGALIKKGVNI